MIRLHDKELKWTRLISSTMPQSTKLEVWSEIELLREMAKEQGKLIFQPPFTKVLSSFQVMCLSPSLSLQNALNKEEPQNCLKPWSLTTQIMATQTWNHKLIRQTRREEEIWRDRKSKNLTSLTKDIETETHELYFLPQEKWKGLKRTWPKNREETKG